MTRQRLPSRRAHEVIRFEHGGFHYHAGIGRFDDGRLAEIFLNPSTKIGAPFTAQTQDAAILTSLALQHGCAPETIRHALSRNSNGQAAGPIGQLLDLLAKGTSEQ
jgi:hypothetical protein